MKQDNFIQSAIDESLSGVRFDAKDARSVLRAVRNGEELPAPRPAKKPRYRFALAMAMTLVLIAPIGLFALRAQQTGTTRISAAPDTKTHAPIATADPHADLIVPAATETARSAEESEVIRIARECFESVCDTDIFTFEEYAVDVVSFAEGYGDYREYTVEMTSIYGNGCAFTVRVALPAGEVVDYSTPALATKPVYLNESAPEIQAWYDKYGAHLMAWPQSAQAEFSRRYEGGMLREAREGELTAQEAQALAKTLVAAQAGTDESEIFPYPVLYSERANYDGVARYTVACFAAPLSEDAAEPFATVSFRADGSEATVTLH